MHRSTKLLAFSNKLTNLTERGLAATQALYDGVSNRRIRERQFVRMFRQVQQVLLSSGQADHILGVPTEDRTQLQHRVRSLNKHDFGALTPWGVYDLHNRITAAARHVAGTSRRSRFASRERLEAIGGDVLRFSLN